LVGLDGVEKMSKSLDNYIGISEPSDVMFSKLMKVQDPQLEQYITHFTNLSVPDTLALGAIQAHRVMARAIVADFHGQDTVQAAEERYDNVAKGGVPDQMKEISIQESEARAEDGLFWVVKLAVLTGFASSNGEARRLIQNKGLKLNSEVVSDDKMHVNLEQSVVLQKGKNDFMRVSRA
jgi:tyrosyl-tRNA synthetase